MISRLNMSSTVFESDINFCPRCGSIMPLPGRDDVVTCMKCKFQVDITEFDGLEMKSKVVFNKRQVLTTGLTSDDFSGPQVDRKCAKCGHDGMTFATRQTRSADEGQTVFYTCPRCQFQEQEYS